jgi:hypothetical protein
MSALNADWTTIGGAVHFDGAVVEGKASFTFASIAGDFLWGVDIPKGVVLDLRNSKVGRLLNDESSWPANDNLQIDGFVYDQIAGKTPSAETQLRWLSLQLKEHFLPQPYEQLATVLAKMGLEEEGRKVMIAKNKEHGRRPNGFLEWCVGIQFSGIYLSATATAHGTRS